MGDNEALACFLLDAGQSNLTVQAFASGLLAGFGHSPTIGIPLISGEAQFSPAHLTGAAVRVVVKSSSLTVLDKVKEKDRLEIEQTMLRDVLEVRVYPEITFQSTGVTVTRIAEGRYRATIIGDLSLHGVTRKGLWIPAQIFLEGDKLLAKGDFTLRQTDYGIKPVSAVGGGLKVKDELKFNFDLTAHRLAA